MARRASSPPRIANGTGTSSAVCLYLTSGEILEGEILSGDGRSIIVGLPGSKRGLIPLGQPIGFELQGEGTPQRFAVVATRNEEQEGVSTVRLVLSNRSTIGGTRGTAQSALFNERASFRLPVQRDSVESATICSVTTSTRAVRIGGTRASVRGARFKATVLDVSFDGLGLLVTDKTHVGLKGALDVHIELATTVGKITIEGLICHQKQLPRGGGVRYGIAAGASRTARWRVEDERQLRRFVAEQQRASLARLRRA